MGQTFRDLLHTKYSSSTKAKARARVQRRIESPKPKKETVDDMAVDDKEDKPVAEKVPSSTRKSPAVADELRSSVSVVSDNGSMDESQDQETQERPQQPPLKDVKVYKKHPGNPTAKIHHRRPQHHQEQRGSTNSLMATLRSSIETFDGHGPVSHGPPLPPHDNYSRNRAYHPMYVDVPSRPEAIAPPAGLTLADLEPLPLREAACVKVDFHNSNSKMESEQSFEEAMDDFALEMGTSTAV